MATPEGYRRFRMEIQNTESQVPFLTREQVAEIDHRNALSAATTITHATASHREHVSAMTEKI